MLLFIKANFNPTGNIVTEQVYIRRIIDCQVMYYYYNKKWINYILYLRNGYLDDE